MLLLYMCLAAILALFAPLLAAAAAYCAVPCAANSVCTAYNKCECLPGFTETLNVALGVKYCAPLCDPPCGEHMTCVAANQCECVEGYHKEQTCVADASYGQRTTPAASNVPTQQPEDALPATLAPWIVNNVHEIEATTQEEEALSNEEVFGTTQRVGLHQLNLACSTMDCGPHAYCDDKWLLCFCEADYAMVDGVCRRSSGFGPVTLIGLSCMALALILLIVVVYRETRLRH